MSKINDKMAYYDQIVARTYYDDGILRWINSGLGGRRKDGPCGCPDTRGSWRTATTINGKSMTLKTHRIIYYMLKGELPPMLDHIDMDHTNNKIENLRPATYSQNTRNRPPKAGQRFKGVYRASTGNKFRSTLMIDGVSHFLGYTDTEEEGARLYDRGVVKFGDLSWDKLNYPDELWLRKLELELENAS